jgi:hypothetical protein
MNRARASDVNDAVSLELIRAPLPATLAAQAESAADNPYACLLEQQASGPDATGTLHHLVVRRGSSLATVLSFRPDRPALVVVNQCVALSDATLLKCADFLLAEYAEARHVELTNAAEPAAGGRQGGMRMRRIPRGTADYVLPLPATEDEYLATLPARSRQRIRNYERRLMKSNPGAQFVIVRRDEIRADFIDAIVALNRQRMNVKGGQSLIDADAARALFRLSQMCGVVCAYRDGDRVLAGAICAKVGTGWTLMVIAHDPQFDSVSLGFVCLVHTIKQAIGDGAKVFHMLWGKYAYKERLGARPVELTDRRIYRTRLHALADWGVMFPVYRATLDGWFWTLRKRANLGRFLPRRRPMLPLPDSADADD